MSKSAWQSGQDVLIYASCPRGAAGDWIKWKSCQNLGKISWQEALDVVTETSCAMKNCWFGARRTARRKPKGNEKSSWQAKRDVIEWPSCSRERRGKINSKKFEKTWKKFLTNGIECDRIKKLSAKQKRPVPCKLNNVKTIFNTLDNKWIV